MSFRDKKLGILLASSPAEPGFQHGLKLAETALAAGVKVYLYCIDQAVAGVHHEQLQALRPKGLNLYACAYASQKRQFPVGQAAVLAGLTIVNDLITSTDRFVAFA